jgi:pellino protein
MSNGRRIICSLVHKRCRFFLLLQIGPYVTLQIGVESSFYCDIPSDPFKGYAFNPCGHMATEKTCKYWSEMRVPQGTTSDFLSVCPFCADPLNRNKPYIKLIFEAARN